MTKKIYFLIIALALFSCKQENKTKANIKPLYFDLKLYFEKEIKRLQQLHPNVDKKVSVNGSVEQKKTKISNWDKELAIFINADINKASWNGSFKHSKTNYSDTYISDNRKIPIKSLKVDYKGNKISKIAITIENTNILFHSVDTLTYYPDSLYEIKKRQKIKLLKEKNYTITGKIE